MKFSFSHTVPNTLTLISSPPLANAVTEMQQKPSISQFWHNVRFSVDIIVMIDIVRYGLLYISDSMTVQKQTIKIKQKYMLFTLSENGSVSLIVFYTFGTVEITLEKC